MFSEQKQNEMETEKINRILETEEEPQSCNENKEISSSNTQITEYKEMSHNEIKNLFNYSSGNTSTQHIEMLDVSCKSKMFKIQYNLLYRVVSDNVRIQEYEIILNSNTLNNKSDNEQSIFIYRDNKKLFLWHYEIKKYTALRLPLSPNNINVVNWVHRVNYNSNLDDDQIIHSIYPRYCHGFFIDLFCQYLGTKDKLLKGKIDMSKYDLLTVYLECSWLNDQVINKYFDLVKKRNNELDKFSIHVFDTFFYTMYSSKGYDRVKNNTKKIDIFSFKKLMFPVNIDKHWLLICYDVSSKNMFYYDSVSLGKRDRVLKILNKLSEYLTLEYSAKKNQTFNSSELCFIDGESPEQNNSYDCGVFTCINGELFSRGKPSNNFNHTHINVYRQKIVYELLNQKLITK